MVNRFRVIWDDIRDTMRIMQDHCQSEVMDNLRILRPNALFIATFANKTPHNRRLCFGAQNRCGCAWHGACRERGGDQLTVWESFKVYDGKSHAVEAFMRILPFEKRNGGWE
jgi:hypothetical protein